MKEKTELVFNQLLSIILIVILVGSLVTQVEISLVSALVDPAIGIKTSSKFGTLQIDHSEYDVTYVNNTTVKVSGTIANLNSIDTKMTILFTLPDGTTTGSQIAPNGDGTFQTSFSLDSNSQKGTYSVSASYAQNTLGALTFTVKLVPVGIQSLGHLQTQAQNQIKVQNITKTSNIATNLHTPIVINDNVTGGDCWLVGKYTTVSKTCTLLQDLPVGIVIASNGITLDGNGHTITGNAVNSINYGLDPSFSGINISGVTGTTIRNINIKNFETEFYLSNSNMNTITANTFTGNFVTAISLSRSSGNTLTDNIINNHLSSGIIEEDSNNNLISNNIISTKSGIYITSSTDDTIKKNTITFDCESNGILLGYSTGTTITDNTLTDICAKNGKGVYTLGSSWSHRIYNNNLISAEIQIGGDVYTNTTLNLPLPIGGNYWSNYNTTTKGCNDLDFNDICDTPYKGDNLPWSVPNGWHTKFTSHGNITTTASSLSGNSIKYDTPSAFLDDASLKVTCSPTSGSIFPIGITLVKCTADNGRKTSFGVSVIDTPPVITTPPDLVVESDNSSGAVVAYSHPKAVDNIGVTNGPTCTPPDGSFFPLGINVVTCTASDGSGNTGSATFTVTVKNTKQQMILECQKNLLSDLFPTSSDGMTWSLHSEKDLTYQGNQQEILGFEREYIKSDSFSSGDLVADIYQYGSEDEANKINNDEITSNQHSAPAGYTQLNGLGFPSECYGMKEDFGFNERVRLFCVKDNFKIYVGSLGNLLGLEDESTNFAKMTINKIGSFSQQHSSLIDQECSSKNSNFASIPNWIRNNAIWWHDNTISDNDFEKGIQYLIQQKIMDIPETTSGTDITKHIPIWVKNNAGMWGNGQISDDEFVKGIQYLIQQGIIKVS